MVYVFNVGANAIEMAFWYVVNALILDSAINSDMNGNL